MTEASGVGVEGDGRGAFQTTMSQKENSHGISRSRAHTDCRNGTALLNSVISGRVRVARLLIFYNENATAAPILHLFDKMVYI